MASAFDADFAANAVPDLMTEMGEAATYTAPNPPGETLPDATICTAIIGPEMASEEINPQMGHKTTKLGRIVKLSAAEVPDPKRGGKITARDTTYAIVEILSRSATMVEVGVIATKATDLSAPGRIQDGHKAMRGRR